MTHKNKKVTTFYNNAMKNYCLTKIMGFSIPNKYFSIKTSCHILCISSRFYSHVIFSCSIYLILKNESQTENRQIMLSVKFFENRDLSKEIISVCTSHKCYIYSSTLKDNYPFISHIRCKKLRLILELFNFLIRKIKKDVLF